MEWIFVSILGVFFLLSTKRKINSFDKHFLLIFQLWWLGIISFSMFNPFSLYKVSSFTYYLLFVYVFLFSISYILMSKIKGKISNFPNSDRFIFFDLRKIYFFLNILLIILFIYLSFYAIRFLNVYINFNDMTLGRLERFRIGTVFSSKYQLIFYDIFIECIMNFIIILIAVLFYTKKVKPLLLLLLLVLFLYSIIGAGRAVLIDLVIYLLFLSIFVPKSDLSFYVFLRMNAKKIMWGISLILFFAAFLTGLRGGLFIFSSFGDLVSSLRSFLSDLTFYNLGSIRALDYGINNIKNFSAYFYGRATLSGIDQIWSYFVKFLGINYQSANVIIGSQTQKIINVSDTGLFNSLYTGIFPFYLDYGVLGVIFFSITLGLLTNLVISNYAKERKLVNLIFLLFLCRSIVLMSLNWSFQSPANVLFIVILLLIKFVNLRNIRFHGSEIKNEPIC